MSLNGVGVNIILFIIIILLFIAGVYFYLKEKISAASVVKAQQQKIKNLRKKVKRLGTYMFISYSDVAKRLRDSAKKDREQNRDKFND